MRMLTPSFKLIAALGFTLAVLTGCSSTDGGGSVSGSVYYGAGFNDPWYYGGYYDDVDIIVTPPDRPTAPPPKPTHPIAPSTPVPRPTPMPSIPSTPRPSFRR
jgi:hypothetical protein